MRTIVRDREILVGRLIKANNKNGGNSESGMENQRIKLEEAKRELEACESEYFNFLTSLRQYKLADVPIHLQNAYKKKN